MRSEGLEPPTYKFVACCSIQLSYDRTPSSLQRLGMVLRADYVPCRRRFADAGDAFAEAGRDPEREGFEPSIQCYPYNGLANRRLQPLGHLSTAAWGVLSPAARTLVGPAQQEFAASEQNNPAACDGVARLRAALRKVGGILMRHLFGPAILLCGVIVGAAQLATMASPAQNEQQSVSQADLTCETLPPWFRSDSTKVVMEKIGPEAAVGPTGNSYFMMTHPFKYVVVHLNPSTSDTAPYLVKLIARYQDDTIYEPLVETIVPKADTPYKWGPLAVMARHVPTGKVANVFNVKVQENYALDLGAKGFSYTVWVEGCN